MKKNMTIATVNATEATAVKGGNTMMNAMMITEGTVNGLEAANTYDVMLIKEGRYDEAVARCRARAEAIVILEELWQRFIARGLKAWGSDIETAFEGILTKKEINNLMKKAAANCADKLVRKAPLQMMEASVLQMATAKTVADVTDRQYSVGDLVKPDTTVDLGGAHKFGKDEVILEVTATGELNGSFQTIDVIVKAAKEDKYYTEKGNLKKTVESGVLSMAFEPATEAELEKYAGMHKKLSNGKALQHFKYQELEIKQFDDHIESTFNKEYRMRVETEAERIEVLKKALNAVNGKKGIDAYQALIDMRSDFDNFEVFSAETMKEGYINLQNFLTEFGIFPSPRFVNTLSHKARKEGTMAAIEYTRCRYEVVGLLAYDSLKEKIQSDEYKMIVESLKWGNPSITVNRHIEVAYGPAGSGKTTDAIRRAAKCYNGVESDVPVVTLSADQLSTEIFFNTYVEPGTGELKSVKTPLLQAIEAGRDAVVDEFNLGNLGEMKAFQYVTDNKPTMVLEGTDITITIHPDYKIYATMNLYQEDNTAYPIPEPVGDRCYDIKQVDPSLDIVMANLL